MYFCPMLLITILLALYLILSLLIVEIENQEDVFIDSITWQGTIITLGDEVVVETPQGSTEGFFRGFIIGKRPILRLSCEGKSRVELSPQDVISIKIII